MGKPSRVLNFNTLPRDPDRDLALVDVRQPTRTRDEIILSEELAEKLERVEQEQAARENLLKHGLLPKGRLLFIGPPGCGKTLCAEILAADLGLPLLYARFDAIVSSFLGETATNLRRVFQYSNQQEAVLFFDEFEALGKRRDDPHDVGELKRVVSSFLQQLDSYPKDRILIAATNHEGLIDEALWRRFDEIFYFSKPTPAQLQALLKQRLRSTKKKDLDLAALANSMEGFTFSDAERVCHEAMKSVILAGEKELKQAILVKEIETHHARILLAVRRPSK